MADGLSSGAAALCDAIEAHLKANYASPPTKRDVPVVRDLAWVPTLQCFLNNQVLLIEVSERPYPEIFRMRRTEMEDVEQPIAVYAACPEEVYAQNQKDAADLAKDGFGLFTIAADGSVTCKVTTIPIAQRISDKHFATDIANLPAGLKRRARECFDLYKHGAPAGVSSLAETLEGMVVKAAKDAKRKGWITGREASGNLANVLVALQGCAQLNGADTIIGAARIFVQRYRNTSAHFPKKKKDAYRKYRDCRHAFLDGLRHMQDFRDAMRAAGLSGTI